MANLVPDTESYLVACLAVAYEIVKMSYGNLELNEQDAPANARKIAREIRLVQQHLYNDHPMPEPSQS